MTQPYSERDAAFFLDYNMSAVVNMLDDENEGLPTLQLFITDRLPEDSTGGADIRGRIILRINFVREADNSTGMAFVFYGPDGAVLRRIGSMDDMPEDADINGALNLAWVGDADSQLAGKMQMIAFQTLDLMAAALFVTAETGLHPQAAFNRLTADAQQHGALKSRSFSLAGVSVGNTLGEVFSNKTPATTGESE